MRKYQSKESRKWGMRKRTLLGVLSSLGIIIAAVAISLPIILSEGEKGGLEEPLPAAKPIEFVMPVAEYTVGMEFKIDELIYSSTLNQWRTHSGVDFLAAVGTDVVSIADGTVTDIKTTTLEGQVVTITHIDGYVSTYKSLGETLAVEKGEQVMAGEKIGTVDVTMITEQAEGAHLHLELTKNGQLVNPLDHLPYNGDK